MDKYAEAAIKTGATTLAQAGDDWGFPKNVLVAALKRQTAEHAPTSPYDKNARQIKDIQRSVPRFIQ